MGPDELQPRPRLVAFRDAFRGIGFMWREEPNMRFHLVAAAGVLVGAAVFQVSTFKWVSVVLAIVVVLLAEILNTAVEALLDLVHPDRHPLVGVVKDLAAGAVLVAAIGATVIALVVFGPEFWDLVSR
ncbi:MAG TPA: diacylglycerol kinase family protein [Acidimicrobiia bacterium]|nr:diacylglycerol kinase family protein [Acidimicrobiia bacterium]